ncbi:hypothetical protein Hanom_Chr09g00835861 [Helianthus anomalus]
MDSPENPNGKSSRSLQGPCPAPLRAHKDSHKIRKPPVAPPQHQHHHQPPPPPPPPPPTTTPATGHHLHRLPKGNPHKPK